MQLKRREWHSLFWVIGQRLANQNFAKGRDEMSGRVIVITGANGGLGRELARQVVAAGDRAILLGRTFTKVEALALELGENAFPIQCIVSDSASVDAAFAVIAERFGKIDALINNAATFIPSRLENADGALIVDSVLSNLAGPMLCVRAALPMLDEGAHIVNVSSETVTVELPMLTIYQATKAGLERFSSSLALELADRGVRVTVFRAGQMAGEGSAAMDPALAMQLVQAAMKRGFNLMERGMTSYASAAAMLRFVLDSPADVDLASIAFHGRTR
jgi:NAD(P)-dependent dehydrogenase (short-subunit alcohol dehydrogenase family)